MYKSHPHHHHVPDVVYDHLRRHYLSREETGKLTVHQANMHVLFYVWVGLICAVLVGTFWGEFAGNYWTPAHFYMPFLLILCMHLTMLPVAFGQAFERPGGVGDEGVSHDVNVAQGADTDSAAATPSGSREHWARRAPALLGLAVYPICFGMLFEVLALAYLIWAHINGHSELPNNNGLLILAYVVSASALVVMALMAWVLSRFWRDAMHIIDKERKPNMSDAFVFGALPVGGALTSSGYPPSTYSPTDSFAEKSPAAAPSSAPSSAPTYPIGYSLPGARRPARVMPIPGVK